jgi:quercetin dioxygenase-like cupin family protein
LVISNTGRQCSKLTKWAKKYKKEHKITSNTKFDKQNIFGQGTPVPESLSQYFIGQAYLNPLVQTLNIVNVTFEPGCRNNWHIHHKGGQILLITGGRGWYQIWGEPAKELHPGDVVNIPPGVKHWHGAAKDSWFSHLAIAVPAKDSSNEWLKSVTDEEYNKLK